MFRSHRPVHHVNHFRLGSQPGAASLSTDMEGRWSSMPGATWKKRELTFLLLLLVAASWEILEVKAGRVFG